MRDHDSVAVQIPDPATQAVLARAILNARRTLPLLTVTVTPRTGDRQWVIDTCCQRIWLSAYLDDLPTALGDALWAMRESQHAVPSDDVFAWMPRQRCDGAPSDLAAG